MRETSIILSEKEFLLLISKFLRNRIIISIIRTEKNAPTGSINAKVPLIVPIELPRKKPVKRTIKSNEYLLHGLTAQLSKRPNDCPKLLCKLVD